MPEIRCPMCGKPNPDDAQNCVHCGARLTPMGTIGQAASSQQPNGQAEDILASLMRDEGASDSGELHQGDEEQFDNQISDWLDADLFEETAPEPSAPAIEPQETSFDEGSISDWLSELPDDEDQSTAEEADWMQELGISEPEGEETLPEILLPQADDNGDIEEELDEPLGSRQLGSTGDLPKWFTRELEGVDLQPVSTPEPAPEEDVDLPEWFTRPLNEQEPESLDETPTLSSAEVLIPWLDSVDETPLEAPGEPQIESLDLHEDAPVLPAEEPQPAPSEPPAVKSEIPEWFAAILENDNIEDDRPSAPEHLPQPEMNAGQQDQPSDKTSWQEFKFDEGDEELPDWFAAVPQQKSGKPEPPLPDQEPISQSSEPEETEEPQPQRKTWNWLTRKAKKPVTPQSAESARDETIPSTPLPYPQETTDTASEITGETAFTNVGDEDAGKGIPETKPGPLEEPGDLPEWLLNEAETGDAVEEHPLLEPEPADFTGTAGLPDWLLAEEEEEADISEEQPQADVDQTLFTGTAGLPDWLLAEDEEADAVEEQAQTDAESAEIIGDVALPEWLLADDEDTDISEEQLQTEPDHTDFTGTAGLPDWLLAEDEEADAVEEQAQTDAESAEVIGDAALPEWLLTDTEESEVGEEQLQTELDRTAFTGTAGLPEWLLADDEETDISEEQLQTEPDHTDFTGTAGLPDWLLAEEEEADAVEEKAQSEAELTDGFGDDALPDWLVADDEETGISEGQPRSDTDQTQFTGTAGLPDWLLAEEESADISEEQPQSDADRTLFTGTAALPAWLLSEEEETGAVEEPEQAQIKGTAELPDWLSTDDETLAFGLSVQDQDLEPGESEPATKVQSDSLEEWFTQPAEASSILLEDDDEFPDFAAFTDDETISPTIELGSWQRLGEESSQADDDVEWLMGEEQPSGAETTDFSDRLDDILFDEQEPVPAPQSTRRTGTAELPAWLEEDSDEIATPAADESAFPAFGDGEFDYTDQTDDEAAHEAFTAALSEIDFSQFEQEPAEEAEETQASTPIWGDDDFRWTGDSAGEEKEPQEPAQQNKIDFAIPQAGELSLWLSEMNAISAAQGELEEQGPLRGLRGLLHGDPALLQFHPPAVYSKELRLSEVDQQRVKVMESILAAEQKGHIQPKARRRNPQMILRIAVSAILVTIILLGLFMPPASASGLIPNPPTQVVQFFQLLQNGLAANPGKPVLIVFDTQPAYASELRAYAELVLKTLMENNVRIMTFSTVPEGTLIGSGIMREVIEDYYLAYDLDTQSINLGYLPGGGAAVRDFSVWMRGVVHGLDVGVSGQYVWDSPLTQDVETIADFATIIVITDNFQDARMWIEQTQPYLPEATQLFMVASAQTSPMLRPYLNAGQIDGLIGGALDAAAYATLSNQINDTILYWTSYRWAIYLMIAIIIGGILYQIGLQVFPPREPAAGAPAARPGSASKAQPTADTKASQARQSTKTRKSKTRRRKSAPSSRRKAVKP
ncbi:MAG: hypothetical protein HPY85_10155 [Anaerolineae bacterium]|nr:hypothetical protein [Anaerolineae bacterium]